MTVIRRHSIHSIVIRRMRDISGSDRTSLHATATVDVAVQTLSRESRDAMGLGLEEKSLIAWFECDQDVEEGDQITVSDPADEHYGQVYVVKELTNRDYGINQHLEAILTEFNE
jgi:hypothetical protein